MYFEVMNGGNLDDNRFTPSKITVFADGVFSVLVGGHLPEQAVVSTIARRLFKMVCDQLEIARTFDADHRSEEVTRIESGRHLKDKIQAAGPALNSNSVQGIFRNIARKKYDTLGICDGRTDGFKTATDSLQSVAEPQQLDRRSTKSGVVDHLTRVGKSADAFINSLAARDLRREMARIQSEADPKKQKTMINEVLKCRMEKFKKLNVFAADYMDVDTEAQLNPRDQARYYLDQSAELERMHSIAN
jgi:hypothetical protein